MASAPRKTEASKPIRITQAALGKHLFLDERSVRELFAKGVFPGIDSSALTMSDLDKCRELYIRNLRDKAAGRAKETPDIKDFLNAMGGDVGDAADMEDVMHPAIQQALTLRENRRLLVLKRLKLENQMIDRADNILAVSAAFARVKSVALRFPKKISKRLVVMTNEVEIRELLLDEVHFMLKELAATPIEAIGVDDGEDEIDLGDISGEA